MQFFFELFQISNFKNMSFILKDVYFPTTIPTNQCFSVYAERKGDGNVMGFEGITFTLVETSVPINIAMLLNFFSPKICHFFIYSSSTFFL